MLIEKAGGILDELHVNAVQFGERLFVLAANHNLCLRAESCQAKITQLKEGKLPIGMNLHTYSGLTSLGVRDGKHFAMFAGMLSQLGGAGTS